MKDSSPIIGDLVEEYREVVLPSRGRVRAALWFARQLASLVRPWMWGGIVLSATFVGRNALDEFAPAADFHARSTVTTFLVAGVLLAAGSSGALRSGSIVRGLLSGAGAAAFGALLAAIGTGGLLAAWHDPGRLATIHASGGLAEAFELPVMMIIPGAVLGTIGGVAGLALRRLRAL